MPPPIFLTETDASTYTYTILYVDYNISIVFNEALILMAMDSRLNVLV